MRFASYFFLTTFLFSLTCRLPLPPLALATPFRNMRKETDKQKLEVFLFELGKKVSGKGCVYLTGGATALLYGWRNKTIDVDLKADPEPVGFFEAIALLKNELDINIELASPDLFIPMLSGWRDRSIFICRNGKIDFYHYDIYSQALAKIERGHERDVIDVCAMMQYGLLNPDKLWELFQEIEPKLLRYPSIDAMEYKSAVMKFMGAK